MTTFYATGQAIPEGTVLEMTSTGYWVEEANGDLMFLPFTVAHPRGPATPLVTFNY